MQKVEKLALAHQNILDAKLKGLQLNISEYTFAVLYLFRNLHHYEVVFDEEIFIKGLMRDGTWFLMPTSHPQTWSEETFTFLRHMHCCLYPLPFEWLNSLEKKIKSFSFNEGDTDYLFNVDKIAHYPGRHLTKKRSLVTHLLEAHQVRSVKYEVDLAKDALEVIQFWQSEKSNNKLDSDYESAIEAVHLYDQLQLTGHLYYVDDLPQGLLIGEPLNTTCFAYHFGKASRNLNGLNQFMFQDFAQKLKGKCQLINFEQDLGLPNLRLTKHSYHPDHLVQKYRVYLVD